MSRRGDDVLRWVPTLAGALGLVGVLAMLLSAPSAPVARGAAGDNFQLPVQGVAAADLAGGQAPGAARPGAVASAAGGPENRQAVKAMLYQAARRHGINAGLVMGLAWWESGWDQSQVSSTGAIGIMQVEPYTADTAGPRLLHRTVDIHTAAANIDLGAAILRENLDRYHGNLIDALVAYYAGPAAVTEWGNLQPDAQRYVRGIYALAVSFDKGLGPA